MAAAPSADRRLIVAGASLSAVGVLVFMTMPLLSGLITDTLGLDYRRVGMVNAAYFLGAALASCSWMWWAPSLSWRTLAHGGCTMLAGALAACAVLKSSFAALLACTLIAGVGAGTLYSLSFVVISSTREPVRGFGWKLFAELTLGAAYLYGLPTLVTSRFGLTGYLLAVAGGTVVLWPLMTAALPARSRGAAQPALQRARPPGFAFWMVIAGISVFMGGLSGAWMFLERIGAEAHISAAAIGSLLSAGVIVACAGALVPTVQAYRLGRAIPHVISACLLLGVFTLLIHSFSTISFVTAAVILPVVWNYALPYQFDLACELDASGAYVVLSSPAIVVGGFVGSLAAGSIAETLGLQAVMAVAATTSSVAAALFIAAVRKSRNLEKTR
jgi:predicted MFS family arabinose efflux permease